MIHNLRPLYTCIQSALRTEVPYWLPPPRHQTQLFSIAFMVHRYHVATAQRMKHRNLHLLLRNYIRIRISLLRNLNVLRLILPPRIGF
ncbi:hypothetical protein SNK03_13627 [Fusarium graminearum]